MSFIDNFRQQFMSHYQLSLNS